MKSIIEKNLPICPTCAFNQCHSGAVSKTDDGYLLCDTCNTKWRDLGGNMPEPTKEKFASRFNAVTIPDPVKTTKHSVLPITAISFVMCLVIAYFLTGLTRQNRNLSKGQATQLSINDVAVQKHNTRGRRFWSVTGIVKNNSRQTISVPSLAFHAGKQGSSGYLKWIYKPFMQSLAPGADFRFRTLVARPKGSAKNVRLEFARLE